MLLDALEAMTPRAIEGAVWRVTWSSRQPLVGSTGGGRWHPPHDFDTLYTSLDEAGALSEAHFHLSKAPVFPSSALLVHRIEVKTERTMVFDTMRSLKPLGVDEKGFYENGHETTRKIAAAARFLGIDSMVVPSARRGFANLILFPDRLDRGALTVADSRSVNWQVWRRQHAPAAE